VLIRGSGVPLMLRFSFLVETHSYIGYGSVAVVESGFLLVAMTKKVAPVGKTNVG
jgi:hypothetical protein